MALPHRLALLAALPLAAPVAAQVNTPVTWAILIGAEQYADPALEPATYAVRDVELLFGTLKSRGAVDPSRIVLMTDKSPPAYRPTRANIQRIVPAHLARAGSRDRVVVYFAGHSFRDKEGGTILGPTDVEYNRGAPRNGVALSAVRKALESCRGATKLFILDTCHAGSARGAAIPAADAEVVTVPASERELGEFNGVYTIASCKENQRSVPFEAKQQGLFTYWINEGLQGLADADCNAVVTADELYKFASQAVRLSKVSGGRQTPCRIVGPNVHDDAAVLVLKSEKDERAAFARVARYVSEVCLRNNVKSLAVAPEFAATPGLQLALPGHGAYGRQAAHAVFEELRDWTVAARVDGRPRYAVIDPTVVRKFFEGKADEPGKVSTIGRKSGAEAILFGELVPLPFDGSNPVAKLQYRLVLTENSESLSTFVSLTYMPSGSYMELFGASARVPVAQTIPHINEIRTGKFRDWMSAEAKKPHPLFDPALPYKLEIRSNGRALPLYYDPPDATKVFVQGKPGQDFQVYIANRSGSRGGGGTSYGYGAAQPAGVGNPGGYNGDMFVRVFVDGLNVLGATPDLPDKAWPFHSEPQTDYLIQGFHYPKAVGNGRSEWEVRPFRFTEAANSLALARGGDENEVGQITAIFSAATEMNWLAKLGATENENRRLRVLFPTKQGKETQCDAYPLAYITIFLCQAPR